MALLHLRVVSPADLSAQVLPILRDQPGATNVVHLPGAAVEPAVDASGPVRNRHAPGRMDDGKWTSRRGKGYLSIDAA